MNWIIDTCISQKIFGYNKNKINTDKVYNVEKLYNTIVFNNKKTIIPIFCLYELLNKDLDKKQKFEILKFINKYNLLIGVIDRGAIIYRPISNEDLEDLNLEKTLQYIKERKLEFEMFEIQEYVKCILFIIKYVIADYLNMQEKNIELIEYIFQIYEMNCTNFYLLVDAEIKESIVDGYQLKNVKQAVKNKVFDIYKKFITELYIHVGNKFQSLKSVCEKEIIYLNQMTTSLDYLRNKIHYIEKHYNLSKYTSEINILFDTRLKQLHYPKDFRKYFISILNKHLYDAKFDKNDSIDSSIMYFKKPNNYIFSGDNSINNYLKKYHRNNFIATQKFLKI